MVIMQMSGSKFFQVFKCTHFSVTYILKVVLFCANVYVGQETHLKMRTVIAEGWTRQSIDACYDVRVSM